MSIKMMTVVWDLPRLSSVEKLILLSLADNANDAGVCWPSIQTIARRTSMTERAVFKVLARLQAMGLIERTSNPGKTTTYKITPEHGSPLNMVQSPLNGVQATPEHGSPRTVIEPSLNQKTGVETATPPASLTLVSSSDGVTSTEKKNLAVRFDSFWEVWPRHKRKVDRAGCQRIWERKRLDEQADAILSAVAMLKQSKDWTKDGGEYIPAPATFLRQERWSTFSDDSANFYDGLMAGAL